MTHRASTLNLVVTFCCEATIILVGFMAKENPLHGARGLSVALIYEALRNKMRRVLPLLTDALLRGLQPDVSDILLSAGTAEAPRQKCKTKMYDLSHMPIVSKGIQI